MEQGQVCGGTGNLYKSSWFESQVWALFCHSFAGRSGTETIAGKGHLLLRPWEHWGPATGQPWVSISFPSGSMNQPCRVQGGDGEDCLPIAVPDFGAVGFCLFVLERIVNGRNSSWQEEHSGMAT